jgi:hypothetical protein
MQQTEEIRSVDDREVLGAPIEGEKRDVIQLSPNLSVENKVDEKVFKVLVGIPLKGHTPAQSYHDRMLMFKNLGGQEAVDFFEKKNPRYVFALGAIGEMLVPYARERLAESALEIGADYLFMIDDDMLSAPDLFYKLVAHDKDIIAPLAFTRNPDHKPVIYETIEGHDAAIGTKYGMTRFVVNYPKNQLVECDAVGFGAVLIKTDVLRRMPKPWFFGMESTGEDIAFCLKARKLGFSVWMDTSIKLGHLGSPVIITEEYSENWNKLTPEQREKMYGRFQKYETENMG